MGILKKSVATTALYSRCQEQMVIPLTKPLWISPPADSPSNCLRRSHPCSRRQVAGTQPAVASCRFSAAVRAAAIAELPGRPAGGIGVARRLPRSHGATTREPRPSWPRSGSGATPPAPNAAIVAAVGILPPVAGHPGRPRGPGRRRRHPPRRASDRRPGWDRRRRSRSRRGSRGRVPPRGQRQGPGRSRRAPSCRFPGIRPGECRGLFPAILGCRTARRHPFVELAFSIPPSDPPFPFSPFERQV